MSIEDDVKTLFAAHEMLAKHLTKRLDDTYDKTTTDHVLSTYVKSDQHVTTLQKLTMMIEARACKQALSTLHESMQHLESELCITKRKADLAAQFVGWYGKEGRHNEMDSK